MEAAIAALGRRPPPAYPRLSLSARDEQVEQDRAPSLLPHHGELARPSPADVRNRGGLDRTYPHDRRSAREGQTGQATLPDRPPCHPCGDARLGAAPSCVSW